MAGGLILLTGGTGHIGFRTLVEALRAGYKVRAAVRRSSSIDEIKATKSVQNFLSNLSFIIIPDITKDGAFDEAVKGVHYIVHVASPLARPADDMEATFIQPAIRGTLSILNSAQKEPLIKRVVITSSQAAVTPMQAYAPGYNEIIKTSDHVPDPSGPYPHYFIAYAASKIMSLNRTLEFIQKEKPEFSVINIMPTFVVGKNELATTKETVNAGSNALAMIPIMGVQFPGDGQPGMTVHVDDVAYVHIASLNPKIEGNHNFGCNSHGLDGIQWNDGIEIVRKHFPEDVKKGVFPLGGSLGALPMKFDTRETEEVFGFKFKSYEDQIVSLAGWYSEVAAEV